MKLILLCCTLLATISCYAQNEIPPFGEFGARELSIKECDFDKEAYAIMFFDVARSSYNDDYSLVTEHRIRFKVLKQKGIDKADVEIPYYSKENFENVYQVEAKTYTRENNGEMVVKELDKKAVFRQKINDVVSVLKFTLPNVKVGTIVDYSYQVSAKNYNGLEDWYFQSDIPTILSRYSLTMVPSAEFTYVVHKSHDVPVKITNDKSSGSINYEMDNIAGLRTEPYMDARKDYLQHVEFQLAGYATSFGSKVKYMTTWKESAQELAGADYFGKQLEKNLANSAEIIARANAFSTPYDKMKFIYEYVKNTFTWNNIDSKYADDGIKNVWTGKKGTSGEINLVLINLLKQAGLQVDPMLVSERDHGKVGIDYPIIDQFNKVVARIVIGNKNFVLDATSVNTPINIIPFSILNTNAFIVNSRKPEVIKLTGEKSASNFINVYSSIDVNGEQNGYATVNSYNYAKATRLEDYKKGKIKFQQDYFEKDYGDMRIDSFEIEHTECDSIPLQQVFKFFMPKVVSGDYKLLNTNLFSGLAKNPFTLDNRFTDIDFGCPQKTDINETFDMPANLKPESLPKNVQLVTPDKSISFVRFISVEENTITIQMSFKVNQTLYTAADYPLLKEFYKKMYSMLSEQIVLSNK